MFVSTTVPPDLRFPPRQVEYAPPDANLHRLSLLASNPTPDTPGLSYSPPLRYPAVAPRLQLPSSALPGSPLLSITVASSLPSDASPRPRSHPHPHLPLHARPLILTS
jgi:hypothetical protein